MVDHSKSAGLYFTILLQQAVGHSEEMPLTLNS